MCADGRSKHFLKKGVCIFFFVTLLSFISWWFRRSGFEKPFDPVKVANDKLDAIIKERDEALRAWAEMGTKHERAIETIIKLRDESAKNFRDLPYLTQRNHELAEENIVRYNEIERLKLVERQYDQLLDDVSTYGMTAKRPEPSQREWESLQRRLQISNFNLQRSEKTADDLKEMLEVQKYKADKEKDWLRAKLKKNARSAAYWAKLRGSDTSDERKLAWGVRCACTEPENAYQKLFGSRKDMVDVRKIGTESEKELGRQKARINELEANQSRLEDTIRQKDLEIEELEDANQEMAGATSPRIH